MKLSSFAAGLVAVLALLPGPSADGARVTEAEAIRIAEWWYAAEVNAATTPLPAAEKQARVASKNKHDVSYILGRDNWQPARQAGDDVAAYVVAFQPSGFVVVSGEDALQPVLVFNALGSFQWKGGPLTNYFSYYLGRCVVGAVEQARARPAAAQSTHANWIRVRDLLKNGITQPTKSGGSSTNRPSGPNPADSGSSYVLLPTATWNQGNHYNNVCVADNGGIPVPTGCVATALAIKMRFHQWPWNGFGSHSYNNSLTNSAGTLFTLTQSVNYASQSYNWYNMPTNDLTADNADVANLMYDAGVAVDMDYGLTGSGAWNSGQDPSPAFNEFFRYRGTYVNNSSTPSDHTNALAYCIQCRVPVVIGTDNHCLVACGYRDTMAPYYFINCGWGGSENNWYYLDGLPAPSTPTINGSLPYSIPDNYAYADAAAASGGNGELQTPYRTFASGQSGVSSSGFLWLKAGQYTGNAGLVLSKPMTINSYLGAATISQ
ncbi:MAG TPA: C10 family peptidase [Candidatus Acidoferrum sp.]|nr:C10 family peptidase [Candidatus Acidoferrum sp.]